MSIVIYAASMLTLTAIKLESKSVRDTGPAWKAVGTMRSAVRIRCSP